MIDAEETHGLVSLLGRLQNTVKIIENDRDLLTKFVDQVVKDWPDLKNKKEYAWFFGEQLPKEQQVAQTEE